MRARAGARTALVAASALAATAALLGCGADKLGDDKFGTYTDCATVGRPSAVSDPAHDQRGVRGRTPDLPQGDLLAVRVARGQGRLCVELRARGPIRPPAAYALALRPPDAERPVVQVEVTVLAAADPELLLNTGQGDAFRKVSGTIGIRGDRLSFVVGRSEFQRLRAERAFDAFRFQMRSAVVTQDEGRLADCAPDCR